MVVADDHDIDERQFFYLARWRGIPFQSFELDWRTTVFEYGVEQDA